MRGSLAGTSDFIAAQKSFVRFPVRHREAPITEVDRCGGDACENRPCEHDCEIAFASITIPFRGDIFVLLTVDPGVSHDGLSLERQVVRTMAGLPPN